MSTTISTDVFTQPSGVQYSHHFGEIVTQFAKRTIPSLDAEKHELMRFARFEADWDTYGAERISHDTIEQAHLLILTVAVRYLIRPSDIFPLNSGAMQVEWRCNDTLLAVEVDARAPLHYLIVEGNGADRHAIEKPRATLDEVLRIAAKIVDK